MNKYQERLERLKIQPKNEFKLKKISFSEKIDFKKVQKTERKKERRMSQQSAKTLKLRLNFQKRRNLQSQSNLITQPENKKKLLKKITENFQQENKVFILKEKLEQCKQENTKLRKMISLTNGKLLMPQIDSRQEKYEAIIQELIKKAKEYDQIKTKEMNGIKEELRKVTSEKKLFQKKLLKNFKDFNSIREMVEKNDRRVIKKLDVILKEENDFWKILNKNDIVLIENYRLKNQLIIKIKIHNFNLFPIKFSELFYLFSHFFTISRFQKFNVKSNHCQFH